MNMIFERCPNCKRDNIKEIIDDHNDRGYQDYIVIHDDNSACKVAEFMYMKRENNIKVEIKKVNEPESEVKKRGRPKKEVQK